MGVTDDAESDNVLESFHKGTVADTELMLAVLGRVVSNHYGKATLSLYFKQLLLEPSKLVCWILTLTPNEEVEAVASVSVVSDNA